MILPIRSLFLGWGLFCLLSGERIMADIGAAGLPKADASISSSTTTATTRTSTATHKVHHRKKSGSVAQGTGVSGEEKATTTRKKSRKTGRVVVTQHGSSSPNPATALAEPNYSEALPPIIGPAPAETLGKPVDAQEQVVMSAPVVAAPVSHSGAGPEVNTGLPVARHDLDAVSRGKYQIASTFPLPTTTSVGTFSSRGHSTSVLDNFTFTNFTRHVRNFYPWKVDIFTTKFWIGEGSTPISSTDNIKSAWDEDWRSNNGGSDTPDDRRGFFPAHHAARINPFYVALPFNDLAFPDKARRWLPAGWARATKDGKQVSACLNRWVEIKNAQGDTCYAQWKDVGPLRYDDAEYVFGDERPGANTSAGFDRAGLDVSPAVADYLDINGKNCNTRWRFVDDSDVQPGVWLKYDEEALIFKAMHELKQPDPARVLPIQRATAPIEDDIDTDSAKRRIGSAKG